MTEELCTVDLGDTRKIPVGNIITQINHLAATLVVREKHQHQRTFCFSRASDGRIFADIPFVGGDFMRVAQEVIARMEMMRLGWGPDLRPLKEREDTEAPGLEDEEQYKKAEPEHGLVPDRDRCTQISMTVGDVNVSSPDGDLFAITLPEGMLEHGDLDDVVNAIRAARSVVDGSDS